MIHVPRPQPTIQLVLITAYCRARIVLVFSILPTVSGPVNSCQRLIEKREKRARACTSKYGRMSASISAWAVARRMSVITPTHVIIIIIVIAKCAAETLASFPGPTPF